MTRDESDGEGRVADSQPRSARTDVVSGGVLFVLALAYGFGARGLLASADPGAALVPMGLAAALALLSAGIALSGWRAARREGETEAASAGPAAAPKSAAGRRPPARAWSVIALTLLYAALFQILGYVVATLLYTAAVAERFGARRGAILVLAPCVTALILLLFRVVLGARLPAGLLG